LPETIMV